MSRFSDNRAQLGRHLADEALGGGLELPEALLDDTVLADMIRERMRYAREYGDNFHAQEYLGTDEKTGERYFNAINGLDTKLQNLYLGNGMLGKIRDDPVDIPEDPEVDRIIDEADLSDTSIFSGGPRKKKEPKDDFKKKLRDAAKAEKKRLAHKKREATIRELVVNMLMKQNGNLTEEQEALVGEDVEPTTALNDIIHWNKRTDRKIRKDQSERDKDLRAKDRRARKVIAYYDDPEWFQNNYYKEHPTYARRKLPNGQWEKKEVIYSDDNPDPALEGFELVKYADAMNKKFTHPAGTPDNPTFVEFDQGAHPADLLEAAAEGKKYTEPKKLEFPEIVTGETDPENNRMGMVRRMLFGELSEEELAYLMDLISKEQQFADGGFVGDTTAFKKLQMIYGPNHPVLSDKRFKVRYVGKRAKNIRRAM